MHAENLSLVELQEEHSGLNRAAVVLEVLKGDTLGFITHWDILFWRMWALMIV